MMPVVGTHMIQGLVSSMEYYRRRYRLNSDHFPLLTYSFLGIIIVSNIVEIHACDGYSIVNGVGSSYSTIGWLLDQCNSFRLPLPLFSGLLFIREIRPCSFKGSLISLIGKSITDIQVRKAKLCAYMRKKYIIIDY